MFEIYSVGDAWYLTRVLNAVAALSGTDNLKVLASIGFLVGVIITVFQGAIQARPPQFQTFFVSLVIYMGMFGPSTSVTVEDVFTGDTFVVDNVPFGVAAIGSGVSQLGYGITELFETAFSTPHSLEDGGYVRPLTMLQEIRKLTRSIVSLGTANYPDGDTDTDFSRSMVNYINDCTLYEVDVGIRSWNDLMNRGGWTTYQSNHNVLTTRLYLNGGTQDLTCRDAWTTLQAYITNNFEPALSNALASAIGREAATFPAETQAILDRLAGAGHDARDYMVQSAFIPLMIQANANASADIQDWGQAAMIEQAGQQRNTQWAAEEVLFSRYVHPVMSFFEAFMYAVTPMMVFAIGLGAMGLKVIARYLVFGLWIQLWMPVLAITNLYTITGAERRIADIQDVATSSLDPTSIAGILAMDKVMGDFLGTAGMLAASTPFITLMLIYGSAYTATALAGRLQGADHIDEKMASPSLATIGPMMQQSAGYSHDQMSGTRKTNAEQVLPRFDIGRGLQRDASSKEGALEQANTSFNRLAASAVQQAWGSDTSSGDSGSLGGSTASRTSELYKYARNEVDRMTAGQGYDEATKEGMTQAYVNAVGSAHTTHVAGEGRVQIGASALLSAIPLTRAGKGAMESFEWAQDQLRTLEDSGTGSATDNAEIRKAGRHARRNKEDLEDSPRARPEGGTGLTGSAGYRWTPHESRDTTRTDEDNSTTSGNASRYADDFEQSISRLFDDNTTFERIMLSDLRSTHDTRLKDALSDTEESRLAEAAQDSISSSREYQESAGYSERYAPSASYSALQVAQQVEQDPQAKARLDAMFSGRWAHLNKTAEDLGGRYGRMAGIGSDEALTIGRLAVLTGQGGNPSWSSDQERDAATSAGFRFIGDVMGASTAPVDSSRHAGLRGAAPAFGGVQDEVERANIGDPRAEAAGLRGDVATGNAHHYDLTRNGPAAVANHNLLSRAELMEREAVSNKAYHENAGSEALRKIAIAASDTRERPTAQHKEIENLDAHLAEVRGPSNTDHQLTDAQVGFYEQHLIRSQPGYEAKPGDINTYDMAKQALTAEDPRAAEHILPLLERAAETRTPEDLGLIRNYNHHRSQAGEAEERKKEAQGVQERLRSEGVQTEGFRLSGTPARPMGEQWAMGTGQGSDYGWRNHPVTGQRAFHHGVDIPMNEGEPIYAAESGVVTRASFGRGYGNVVYLDHGDRAAGFDETRYGHMSRFANGVTEGQFVEKGQVIGYAGSTGRSTGNHLHFETRQDGKSVDPESIMPWIAQRGAGPQRA